MISEYPKLVVTEFGTSGIRPMVNKWTFLHQTACTKTACTNVYKTAWSLSHSLANAQFFSSIYETRTECLPSIVSKEMNWLISASTWQNQQYKSLRQLVYQPFHIKLMISYTDINKKRLA